MRISLIHGEDSSKAYQRFRELLDGAKAKSFEIIAIDDVRKIVSQSLFDDKTVFILEKAKKVKPNDWKWLSKNASKYNSNLLIYWEGKAPATITRNLSKTAKKEKFEFPKIIFTFLDSFYPGNSKICLKLLNDLSKNEPIELVFHLLSLRMRELFWIKTSPETLNLPAWRKTKLLNQASKYQDASIKDVIKHLSEIDIKSKTSGEKLKPLLDFLIVQELE